MLEEAGCFHLAVHGKTRDEKDRKKFQADWKAIKAVKNVVRIPADLLESLALFAGYQTARRVSGSEGAASVDGKLDQADLLVEYLKLCEKYPVPWRIIHSHVHKLLGDWFSLQPHIRDELNKQYELTFKFLYDMIHRLRATGIRIPLYLKDTQLEPLADSYTDEHS